MKITKSQLKQIIKEELEVTLTNEEAGEMFGEEVEAQLNEMEAERVSSMKKTKEEIERAQGKAGTWKTNEARRARIAKDPAYAKWTSAAQARAASVKRGEEVDLESDLEIEEDDT